MDNLSNKNFDQNLYIYKNMGNTNISKKSTNKFIISNNFLDQPKLLKLASFLNPKSYKLYKQRRQSKSNKNGK